MDDSPLYSDDEITKFRLDEEVDSACFAGGRWCKDAKAARDHWLETGELVEYKQNKNLKGGNSAVNLAGGVAVVVAGGVYLALLDLPATTAAILVAGSSSNGGFEGCGALAGIGAGCAVGAGPRALGGPISPQTAYNDAASPLLFERLKADLAQQELLNATPTGSALKGGSGPYSPRTFNQGFDLSHAAPAFARDTISEGFGRHFTIEGADGVYRNLTQVPGNVNGVDGIFEFIVDPRGLLTHERWIPGGKITGIPNL